MGIKEIREAMEKGSVMFGVRQALKNSKKASVYVTKDCRDETRASLESSGISFSVLRTKRELARELNLDFESEVLSLLP